MKTAENREKRLSKEYNGFVFGINSSVRYVLVILIYGVSIGFFFVERSWKFPHSFSVTSVMKY